MITLLLLITSLQCHAGDISNSLSNNSKFITAFDHAQQAFLIHVGFIDFQDKLKNYFRKEADTRIRRVIHNYGIEKEIIITAFIYNTIQNKEISFKWLNKDWTVGINKLYVRIPL